ncbi:hypothetical protein HDV01_002912 [Terramyces sp. JEL0728]|nr:hypothetical protein HDV01_002912 [Terramyces sp. JEL0728]
MSRFPPTISAEADQFVKRLFLCRHGETKANATGVLQGSGIDIELNDKGIKQAELLRDQLANETVNRAIQTAKIVSERHPNAEFIEIEEFAEISWGEWEGSQSPMLPKLLTSWQEGDFYGFELSNISKKPQWREPHGSRAAGCSSSV